MTWRSSAPARPGLATAVYAASEGLSVLVLDSARFRRPGRRVGADRELSRLSDRHLRPGAGRRAPSTRRRSSAPQIAIPLEVTRLDCSHREERPDEPLRLELSNGQAVRARIVVVASGARYRRPEIANLATFEGAGVSYWASPMEARLCEGGEVALVGGGNSAGQAVVFLAPKVKRLHLIIRGKSLESSMSRYLIDRISALPNVELHSETEVIGLEGDRTSGLTAVMCRSRSSGVTQTRPLRHLFLFIGAEPNGGWLRGCVAVDGKGFVITGAGVDAEGRTAQLLETNLRGVFAIGDVRAGSTKRVAAAVGEGAAVVAQIHGALAKVAPQM